MEKSNREKFEEYFGPTSDEDLSTPSAVVRTLERSQYRKVVLIEELIRYHTSEAFLRGYELGQRDARLFYDCGACMRRAEQDREKALAGRTMQQLIDDGYKQSSRKYRLVDIPGRDGTTIELTHEQFQEFRALGGGWAS